jgi:hypothetical protein
VASSLSSSGSSASMGGGWGDWSDATTPAPIVGATVCNAATRCARKRAGSLSPSSSESQAAGRPQPATHALARLVFPKPAGAEIRVSLRCSPSFSRAIRSARSTAFCRGGGINSLVVSTGAGIAHYRTRVASAESCSPMSACALLGVPRAYYYRARQRSVNQDQAAPLPLPKRFDHCRPICPGFYS